MNSGANPARSAARRAFKGQSIEAVVFDLDDTLWPIAPVIIRAETAMREWIAQHVPDVAAGWDGSTLKRVRSGLITANPAIANDVMALRRGTIFAAFDELGGTPLQAALAFNCFSAARQKVEFYPDALPALERLAAHFRLGVISNGFANVQAIGIGHWFEVVISAHEVGVSKPEPAIYHACVERMALPGSAMLYAGDDPHNDVVGPQAIGLKAAWINRSGASWPQSLDGSHSPDGVFADLTAFADWMLDADY